MWIEIENCIIIGQEKKTLKSSSEIYWTSGMYDSIICPMNEY
jgi:hypothetical protein